MELVEKFYKEFCEYLENHALTGEPQNLYDPVNYILGLKAKRFRPIAALLSSHLYKENNDDALIIAYSLEMFHNFSLVHDDIMDNADKRRSKEATHIKFGIPSAILSGDVMLVEVFRILQQIENPSLAIELQKIMADSAKLVCEGQQMDMNFEKQSQVSIDAYIKMIKYKTAVLLAAAFKMGARINQVPQNESQLLYDFGINLGLAFQMDDDILDSFGDPATFGKKVGGDILQKKKTILYILACEEEQTGVEALYAKELEDLGPDEIGKHIESVKSLFISSKALEKAKSLRQEFAQKAEDCMNALKISENSMKELTAFYKIVLKRSY